MARRKPVALGEQVAALAATLNAHTEEDTRRFVEVNGKLDGIGADVKALLGSRSYDKGFWKAVLLVSGGAGTVAGLIVAVIALWK